MCHRKADAEACTVTFRHGKVHCIILSARIVFTEGCVATFHKPSGYVVNQGGRRIRVTSNDGVFCSPCNRVPPGTNNA